MIRLKIISDGTGPHTRVINEETSEEIRGITSIQWDITDPRGLASAIIKLVKVPVEVICEDI